MFGTLGGLRGSVLGSGGKGFGLRRGGFGVVVLGFGVGEVEFTVWCVGYLGSLGGARAMGVWFGGWGVVWVLEELVLGLRGVVGIGSDGFWGCGCGDLG